MDQFQFQLGDEVSIAVSGERGSIVARAEYATGVRSYLVRYKAGDGRAVENWWHEDALTK